MYKSTGIIIQGLSVLDIIKNIGRNTKKVQAKMLNQLELELSPEDFSRIRKIILDNTNDLSRSVVKEIFGEIDV